jgi:DNA primase
MDILTLAQSRIPGLKKKTANEWAGPCPECGGTDRFLIWTHRDAWHCRGCNQTGDAIEFLRKFEGQSCPDAHETLGLGCNKNNCQAWEGCRLGARANGETAKKKQRESLTVPVPEKDKPFEPAVAAIPQQKWQQQAAVLIAKAHAALLDSPEQIDYLTARGIPLEAIQKGQLGWLPENRYPSRKAWGLPELLKENNQPKKLFIPAGILIPFFDDSSNPHRIRIRRSEIREQEARYYWLSGSGDDVPVIGGVDRQGVVVVESDLDAFMVRWQCRDLDVSVIPLGTCSAKPKGWAMQALEKALAILVAHDFEPRHNEKTGKNENPGGQGARWWLNQFTRAIRWPVPAGKDPGEYYQDHSGNIRAWVLAGLPPAFHVQKPVKAKPERSVPEHVKGTTVNGHSYVVAYHITDVGQLIDHYPEAVVFSPEEMAALKGMSQEEAELMLLVKKNFNGKIIETKPFEPADQLPLPPEPEAIQEELIY